MRFSIAEQYNFRGFDVNNYSCFTQNKHGCSFAEMNIGKRLREARQRAGLTQARLAEISGVSQQMISKLEKGHSESTTDLVALAIACKVRPEWLYDGAMPMEGQTASDSQLMSEIQELAAAYSGGSMEQRQAMMVFARSLRDSRAPSESNNAAMAQSQITRPGDLKSKGDDSSS